MGIFGVVRQSPFICVMNNDRAFLCFLSGSFIVLYGFFCSLHDGQCCICRVEDGTAAQKFRMKKLKIAFVYCVDENRCVRLCHDSLEESFESGCYISRWISKKEGTITQLLYMLEIPVV
jgi:hypothetical protein